MRERGESAPGCAGRPLGKLHLCANRFEPWLPAEGVIAREVWMVPVDPGGTDARRKPVKGCPSHQDACSRGVRSARGAGRGHATGRERDACRTEERLSLIHI